MKGTITSIIILIINIKEQIAKNKVESNSGEEAEERTMELAEKPLKFETGNKSQWNFIPNEKCCN